MTFNPDLRCDARMQMLADETPHLGSEAPTT
jgi:hypothetical protein